MKRFAVPAAFLVLAGCAATSPLARTHGGRPEPPVPVPTADRPDAYDYLPAVMGGECSEAEYPLFARLNGLPLEQTRRLLEALGVIRDHKLVPVAGGSYDQGWMKAINGRERLFWKKEFATPDGPRVAWLFIQGSGAGNQGQRTPATAIVSGADNEVIAFKTTDIWLAFKLRPVELAYPDATVLEVVNRYERVVDHGNGSPVHEFPPDVIRFSAAGIEVDSRDPQDGFGFSDIAPDVIRR